MSHRKSNVEFDITFSMCHEVICCSGRRKDSRWYLTWLIDIAIYLRTSRIFEYAPPVADLTWLIDIAIHVRTSPCVCTASRWFDMTHWFSNISTYRRIYVSERPVEDLTRLINIAIYLRTSRICVSAKPVAYLTWLIDIAIYLRTLYMSRVSNVACTSYIYMYDLIYSRLQIRWHRISRLFLKKNQQTTILPTGFTTSTN